MKSINIKKTSLAIALIICAMTLCAKDKKDDIAKEYQVITRLNKDITPAAFTPTVANNTADTYHENVMTATNKVLNKESKMLKFGKVQTVGEESTGAWQMMCDEGGSDYEQSALNPLSYMLGGEPDCSRCQTVCPFTKFDEAVLHDLIRMSIGSTDKLNGAIRKMDDVFGYGKEPDLSKTPWELDYMDIPIYGLDKSRT